MNQESWHIHLERLQKQHRSSLPYLRTIFLPHDQRLACLLRELTHINASQPTYIDLHDGYLCATDDPVIIPAQPGTGMINLRKFRSMYDVVGDALDLIQSPCSFWYRLFPEDPQFPNPPTMDETVLARFDEMRTMVEGAIASCWKGDSAQGDWERHLHIKRILASAGF